MIEIGDKVVVNYRGTLENGLEFDASYRTGKPLEFVVGNHQVVPGFEKAVIGLSKGDSITVNIPAAEAYGERREDLIENVPVQDFPNAEKLPVGDYIEIRTPNGIFRTKVAAVEDGFITFDHNHELAGKNLIFDIDVVDVIVESAIERELHPAGCACGCHELKAQIDKRG